MRRRNNRSSSEQTADIDMTPMLDIVFIMLIFFIVTTSFVKESGIDVNRPTATQTATRKKQGNIIVAIKPNGDVWIDKRQVDIRAVKANVSRLHAEQPLGSVIIASDKKTKVEALIQVMDQIRSAGIMDAAIATEID